MGLAGGSQAAIAAKVPAPAPGEPDPRQIDLEDAIGALTSSLDGDRLC